MNSLQKKIHEEKKIVHPNMYTKYLCLKARRVSLSSIHFSFVICSLMQMNWPQANRFITWQHIHKASSIQRKESWTTVTEDTKKCTDPKLRLLAINRFFTLINSRTDVVPFYQFFCLTVKVSKYRKQNTKFYHPPKNQRNFVHFFALASKKWLKQKIKAVDDLN